MMANRQALDDATVERLTYAEDATVALLAGEVLRLRQTVLRMLVADDEPDEDERQLAVARQEGEQARRAARDAEDRLLGRDRR